MLSIWFYSLDVSVRSAPATPFPFVLSLSSISHKIIRSFDTHTLFFLLSLSHTHVRSQGDFFLVNSSDRVLRVFSSSSLEAMRGEEFQDHVNKLQWKKAVFSGSGEFVIAVSQVRLARRTHSSVGIVFVHKEGGKVGKQLDSACVAHDPVFVVGSISTCMHACVRAYLNWVLRMHAYACMRGQEQSAHSIYVWNRVFGQLVKILQGAVRANTQRAALPCA